MAVPGANTDPPGSGGGGQSADMSETNRLLRGANQLQKATLSVTEQLANQASKWTGQEFGPGLEKLGAKFSLSYHQSFEQNKQIAARFMKLQVPASVYDAFVFQLHALRLGLRDTVDSQADLYKSILATGEQWATLQRGLFQNVAGAKNQTTSMGVLSEAVEESARTFNVSRTALVEAMGSLDRKLINLTIAAGGNADEISKTVLTLRGLLPDQRLFGEAVSNLQKQFTLEGLTESIVMGFPTDAILRGQKDDIDILEAILDQGSIASNIVQTQGRDTIFQLEALRGGFGDLGSKISVRQAIIERATAKGITNALSMTNRQLAQEISELIGKETETNTKFRETLEMFRKEIFQPVIQSAAEFFLRYKEYFAPGGEGAKLLGSYVELLARTGQLMMEGSLKAMQVIAAPIAKVLGGGGDWLAGVQDALKDVVGLGDDMKGFFGAFDHDDSLLGKLGKIETNTRMMAEEEEKLNSRTRDLLDATRKRDVFEIRQTRGLITEFRNLTIAVKKGGEGTITAIQGIDVGPAGDGTAGGLRRYPGIGDR